MPKIKTHRGAAKRTKQRKDGYRVKPSEKNHILTKKSTKRKRQLRGLITAHDADKAALSKMLPNSK